MWYWDQGSRLPLPLVVLALPVESTHSHTGLFPRRYAAAGTVQVGRGKLKETGGGLGKCVMVLDILQDVHFIHSLDLLLLLWSRPSF